MGQTSLSIHVLRSDRTRESGKLSGGGLGIYVKDSLTCLHLQTYNICNPNIEFTCVKLKLTNNRPFYICCVYRPPSGSVDEFILILERTVSDIVRDKVSEVLLLGDMNIDICINGPTQRKYRDYVS